MAIKVERVALAEALRVVLEDRDRASVDGRRTVVFR